MQVFEKIKEKCIKKSGIGRSSFAAFLEVLDEVEQEYNNGWIPCSERLPIVPKGKDEVDVIVTCIPNGKPPELLYTEYDDYEGFNCRYQVIAWQYNDLKPYNPKGD